MDKIEKFIDNVSQISKTDKIFTYPGTPGQHIYQVLKEKDEIEMQMTAREQHILNMAQARYYRKLEKGEEEIPVAVVCGEMGESLVTQPLIAGNISAPILLIVTEMNAPHKGNTRNMVYQSERGKIAEETDEKNKLLEHDSVVERKILKDAGDKEEIKEVLDKIRDEKGVGIVHLPWYAYMEKNKDYGEIVDDEPGTKSLEEVEEEFNSSDRPLIIAGRGVSHPEKIKKIEEISEKTGATIVSTFQTCGKFKTNYAGNIGICGTPSANEAFFQSDVVLALGTSLNITLTTINPEILEEFKRKTIQVEDSGLMKSYFVDSWSEESLDEFIANFEPVEKDTWFKNEIRGLEELRNHVPDNIKAVGEFIREKHPEKIVNIGVSNAIPWISVSTGPKITKEVSRIGSMGEAVAGITRDEKPIIIMGDGEMEMDLSVIVEAHYQGTNPTFVIVKNNRLGLLTERQKVKTGEILTPKENFIDYSKIGDCFINTNTYNPETPEQVKKVLEKTVDNDEVDIVVIPVTREITPELINAKKLNRLKE